MIKRLLNLSEYHRDPTMRKSVRTLLKRMETARIVDETDMPKDIVRLNSIVTVSSKAAMSKRFRLVLSGEHKAVKDRISILDPMGTAVLGCAENEVLCFESLFGKETLCIQKVQQVKHSGNSNVLL